MGSRMDGDCSRPWRRYHFSRIEVSSTSFVLKGYMFSLVSGGDNAVIVDAGCLRPLQMSDCSILLFSMTE
ncbi:hypothetical protein SAMN04487948_11428 [Halogranum amylolyticum]|uniref:Uncharacterized protein n=1 Tax=Halogranum amylolyticum TaxID=660520 RepID=A0A1H8V483_9EURY|nr:hypothetical protein SAMN04487948_11428 [Halogranum amylolyticum]